MHSSEAIAATDFNYRYDDESTDQETVIPDITIPDRLGVVLREPFDGLGAATFVLACVTAFYDAYRIQTDDFYAYPDYFTFQSDGRRVDYRWFDIWPEHKNVQTDHDAETVLRAINDRGITYLLVPNGKTGNPDLEAVTRESFERRIDACYLYAPDGQLDGPAFSIHLPRDPVWKWMQKTVDTIDDEHDELGTRHVEAWRTRIKDGTITQAFRRISPEDALRYLPNRA